MGEEPRAPSGPAEPGQRIAQYEIVSEIGRGGMGVIYRARDTTLGRSVALKCPWPPDPDPRQRSRLMREARATSRLSHPHIVPLFEVIEENGTAWLAMDLVEGTTLRSLLARGEPLPLADALRHAEGLAGALQAAHGQGILHRDVNPNNIMLTADGRAVLTDFGLAQFVRVADTSITHSHDSELDGDGHVVGTPHYMSPEQVLGKPLDPRSDIFALGAVLYEMCTGRRAFPGRGGEVMDAILHQEPKSAVRINSQVPAELERIVRKALARNPDERHQDARDLLVDIRTLRRQVDQASYTGRPGEPGRRAPVRWLLAAVAVAAAGLVAFAVLRNPDPAPIASPSSRMRVGVLPHLDLTGRGANDGWPELIQALYVRELTGVKDLGVMDPMSLNGRLETALHTRPPRRGPDLYTALRDAGVTFVVDGTVSTARDGMRIQTNLVQPTSGEVSYSIDAVVRREEDLPEAVAGLSRQLLSFLQLQGLATSEAKDLRPWVAHRAKNLDAIKAFVHASEYAMRHQPGSGPYLLRAVELDPTFVSPRVWLISAYVNGGAFEKAKEHYRILQGLEAGASPFDQAMIGWAGAFIARESAAQVRHLEVALSYSPGNNILLVNLAEAHFRGGSFGPALAALEQPIAAGWKFPPLRSFHAACLLALERYEEAERTLTGSPDVAHTDPDAWAILSVLATRRGETNAADRHRQEYLRRSRDARTPPGSVHDGLATLFLLAGLYRPAADELQEAAVVEGGRLEPTNLWSEVLDRTWKGEEFKRGIGVELTRDPGWAAGHLLLGRIEEIRGQRDEALRQYETFLTADPQSRAAGSTRMRAQALRAVPASAAKR